MIFSGQPGQGGGCKPAAATFLSWRTSKKVRNIDEEVMLAFVHEKADKLKSSTLWSTYSMLKSTLRVKENMAIDHNSGRIYIIYIEESINNKRKTSQMIFNQTFSSPATEQPVPTCSQSFVTF
ncbi:hypothetical protein Zmor_004945 [Zophobas morio]|uniref:Uncharacterized protein n=1 Tax=Zophobas morio TaxID=2755281 RepID=A0AA38IT43_9CUCU|nr:hypothetical protein Zmor_004945 [Zophobas morio]